MKKQLFVGAAVISGVVATTLWAQVMDSVTPVAFVFNGQEKSISQSADTAPEIVARFAVRAGDCRDICVGPASPAPSISAIGEAEVINFVGSSVANGDGLLIDARTQVRRSTGFIPGSINVPVALLAQDNPYFSDILLAMGGKNIGGEMEFSDALPVVVFDDGPMMHDASDFINALIGVGYPASKIRYYRGGMLVWSTLGLSIEEA